VINETMARDYWPGVDPVGARFRLGGGAEPSTATVIGVVGDVRHNTLADGPTSRCTLPIANSASGVVPSSRFEASHSSQDNRAARCSRRNRTPNDSLNRIRPCRLVPFETMDAVRADSVSRPRFVTVLLSIFSATALLVALVGIYGVVAYSVAQRRRELGVRLAFGATPSNVVALVLLQGMRPVGVGLAAGLGGGLAATGVLRSLLFQVSPRDPAVAIAVLASITVVAALACYLPARRAALADPLIALRSE
jgi:hypothetical protein